MTDLFLWLIIGGVAGFLAGQVMKGGGFGLLINIVLGIVGAVVGGFLFGLLGVNVDGLIGSIITATIGAIAVLFVINKLR